MTTTLYFNQASNSFNAANQCASLSTSRKLGAAGSGLLTATDTGFNLDKGAAFVSDGITGGANGAFGVTAVIKTAGDPEKYRARLSRYNSAGVLQAAFEITTDDRTVYPGFKSTFDTLTWSFPSVDLGTWAEGDLLGVNILFAQTSGGRRGVTNVIDVAASSVTVPW